MHDAYSTSKTLETFFRFKEKMIFYKQEPTHRHLKEKFPTIFPVSAAVALCLFLMKSLFQLDITMVGTVC